VRYTAPEESGDPGRAAGINDKIDSDEE